MIIITSLRISHINSDEKKKTTCNQDYHNEFTYFTHKFRKKQEQHKIMIIIITGSCISHINSDK